MKAVIISGGNAPSLDLVNKEITKNTIIICADRGADCAYKYNINPHYIIGDLDSINKECLSHFRKNKDIIFDIYPTYKDFTDTYIALNKAIELKCDKIVFLGCTGTRLDHFLGNLGLLKRCLDLSLDASIKDDNNTIIMINRNTVIEGEKNSYFSLQAYSNIVTNLTINGCKYELHNYDLLPGDSLTVSNEFKETKVNVSFTSGILIIMYCKD